MSITDELRSWAKGNALRAGMSLRTVRDHALAIADHIDETVESEYVKLPRDADGEPINPGDVIADERNTYTVTSIRFNSCGAIVYGHTEAYLNAWPIDQTNKMHHVKHTIGEVEDMLEEYRIRYYNLVTDMECKHITNDEYARGIKSLNADYADRIREAIEHERD